MTAPDVAALAAQLHTQFGCRITCRGGRLADDGHPSHAEAWANTAEAIIAALAAQGWRITDEDGFADGIDRAAERVLSSCREGDSLAYIVAVIRGEQP